MITISQSRYILILLLFYLSLSSGCGGLPEYAQPHLYPGGKTISGDALTYRELTQSDFQATSVPDRLSKYKKKLNAHTAVSIRPVFGAKYIVSKGMIGAQHIFHGRVENLAFEAVMIPTQSWWNPAVGSKKRDYVLQHEQIHFALMEVAAKKLTLKVKGDPFVISAYGNSVLDVKRKLREEIGRLLEKTQRLSLESHTDFDEDTSMRHNPVVQQEWYDEVMAELLSLSVSNFSGSGPEQKGKSEHIQ
ncbi:MAG: hypothetical protein ACN4GW_21790 [Desulforhopalus sp.]